MRRTVALVGFMGAGKSAVGKAVAARLGAEHLDTDSMVSQSVGMSVQDVFASLGEETFRRLEAEAVMRAACAEKTVLSVGGGAVENAASRDALKRNSFVVYLKADPNAIVNRTAGVTGRPLLDGCAAAERRSRVHLLLARRERRYLETSHATVDANGPISEVVENVLAAFRAAFGKEGERLW